MPVLGIDIGTQSLKATILGDDFRSLGSGSVPYQPYFPRPGWAEQDPRLWLAALGPAIAGALEASGVAPTDIAALAVCGQLDGCVPTASNGEPAGPAVIWMDRRAAELIAPIDPQPIRDRCGLVLDAGHMGAKIAWLAANSAADVATWHQPVTFLVEALTGVRVISRSLASTTMLCRVGASDWDDALLGMFDARREMLPAIAGESDLAGRLTAAGAALTGLPVGVPVAVGTGDDFSNLVGSGIARPGAVAVSLGTAETVGALHARAAIDPDMLVETHAFPGGFFHLGNPGWLGGGAVRWASRLLSIPSDAAFVEAAAQAPAGCEGLVFIPALAGAMTPKWLAEARGTFIGLTPGHGSAHMARAVLEGTAFAMRDVVDRLDALGVPTDAIRLMGGGSRGNLWCQIRADLSGRPVEVLNEADASPVGAALMAAVLAGIAPDLAGASEAMPLSIHTIDPDRSLRPAYDDAYGRYRRAFAALEGYWATA